MTEPLIREFDGETWLRATDVVTYLLGCADWADFHNLPGNGITGEALRAAAEKLSVALSV